MDNRPQQKTTTGASPAQILPMVMSAAASSPAKRKRSGSLSPPQPRHPPPRRRSRRNEANNNNNNNNNMDIEDMLAPTSTASALASPSLPSPIDPRPPMPLAPTALLTSMERRALGLSGLLLAAFVGDAAEFAKEAHRVSTLSSSSSSHSSSSSSSSASTAWGRLDARGRSVLHAAASSGHPTILQHVLAAQMLDIDTEAEGGLTALCYSLDRRDLTGATTLLAGGADPGRIEEIYGLWDSEWASEQMGLFGTSRADALAMLKLALCAAVALKDEWARPWLDGETQLLLFEEWKAKLKVGSRVDARDCDYRWYEAEVIGVFPGGVRVSYLSWGKRFDEDLGLDSLRVLPAYSVVPAWRETLAVGSQVEILAAAAEAEQEGGQGAASEGVVAGGGGGGGGGGVGVGGVGLPSSPSHVRWEEKERKWWDATALDIDRRRRKVLLSVDGRPSLSRWVEIDGREIADIGTHVKAPAGGTLAPPPPPPPPPLLAPPPFPHPLLVAGGMAAGAAPAAAGGGGGGGLFIPPRGEKEPVPATTRQIQAREAANTGDLPTLLSFINVQDPAALRLTYYRRKLHLVAAYSPEAPTRGVGCPLLTARREQGVPELCVQQQYQQHQQHQQQQEGGRSAKKARVGRLSSSGSSSSSSSSSSSVATMSFAERREKVLSHVVTELNEDLFVDLLLEYW